MTGSITWIARKPAPQGANRRGCGVGFWNDAVGRRRYVRYTDSETLHPCRREDAISLLAVMAGGTGHTGAATLAATERKV